MSRPKRKSLTPTKIPTRTREADTRAPAATEALELRRRLYDLTRLVSDWVWETDRDFRLTYVSERIMEVLGLLPLELVGKSLLDLGTFPAQEGKSAGLNWRSPFRDAPFETRDRDGNQRMFLISGLPFFDPETEDFIGVRGIAENVTERVLAAEALQRSDELLRAISERKQAEEALRENEERLKLSLRSGQIGTFYWSVQDGTHFWDDRMHEIWGLEPGTYQGTMNSDFLDSLHADDVVRVNEAIRRTLEDDADYDIDYRIIHPDKTIRHVHALATLNRDEQGRPMRLIGVILDITERKRVEEALHQAHEELEVRVEERTRELRVSETRFRDFAEGASDWFWEMDEHLRFTYLSARFAEISGVAEKHLTGKTRQESGLNMEDERMRRNIEDLEARRPFKNFEHSRVRPDGSDVHMSTSGTPIFDEDGAFKGYRGTGSDITERERVGEQLHQSQKMEAVGQLTGGVAHDFNNLLAVINGYIELMADSGALEDGIREMLDRALRAVDRGAKLTDQLLTFSRQQVLEPKTVEVNTLLFDTIDLLLRTLGEDIDIKTAFDTHIPSIKVDPGMLENAILNLALNARDAMPDGGKVTIKTANVDLDGKLFYDNQSRLTGPHVLISISDTGTGIKKKDLDPVFEPFFTTKDVGEGTGLGLSMVFGFVKQSGGHMTLDSERGKGTTANLYFPVAESLDTETAESTPRPPTEVTGTKRILVVEDDDDVRKTAVRMLSTFGYGVLEAEDGPSALKVLGKHSKDIGLVFSDVIMPSGMSGFDLANELKHHYQHIKVLMTSGYPENLINRKYIDGTGIRLLRKPYKKADLAKAVRTALDQ